MSDLGDLALGWAGPPLQEGGRQGLACLCCRPGRAGRALDCQGGWDLTRGALSVV